MILRSLVSPILMNVEVNVTCPSPGIPPPSLSSRSILGSDDTANTQLNAWWDLVSIKP